MKIGNSKKQLAKIIHENGGWRDGAEFAAQDSVKDSCPCRICFYSNKPKLETGARRWFDGNNGIVGGAEGCIHGVNAIPNWHQTILSREEYFHLYPAPVKVVVENKTTCHLTVADKPTIEQLAADYRNRKDFADRKQQEADAAKADAEAKLAELVAAGKAIGLELCLSGAAPKRATFHNSAVGAPKMYEPGFSTEICDGCGKTTGRHFGRLMFCSHEDVDNA